MCTWSTGCDVAVLSSSLSPVRRAFLVAQRSYPNREIRDTGVRGDQISHDYTKYGG